MLNFKLFLRKEMNDYNELLILPATINQIKAVKELIDYREENGNSAILIAARHNEMDMLQLLVDNGASVNVQDGWGMNTDWVGSEASKFVDD